MGYVIHLIVREIIKVLPSLKIKISSKQLSQRLSLYILSHYRGSDEAEEKFYVMEERSFNAWKI